MAKITAYEAVKTQIWRTEPTYDSYGTQDGARYVYPRNVTLGRKIGEFGSVAEIYKHLYSLLSVDGLRSTAAVWGNKGYMCVSVYEGEGYAQNANGARLNKYCG